jgi:hypothetical protein
MLYKESSYIIVILEFGSGVCEGELHENGEYEVPKLSVPIQCQV